jgi:hypothetical protein
MPDYKITNIKWSTKSLDNASLIKTYLKDNFSQKEINSFFSLLEAFQEIVTVFPKIYPESKKTKIRRAV